MRIIKYIWFKFIMASTAWMLDFTPSLKLRGFLLKPAFKRCGKNFQVASGTDIKWSSNICIGDNVFIANNCWIQGYGSVELEDEVMLGPFTVIASNNHTRDGNSYRFGPSDRDKIVIGAGSWTGAHVCVTAGTTIGKGCAVAANAVITKDVPDNCMVAGIPGKVVKSLE